MSREAQARGSSRSGEKLASPPASCVAPLSRAAHSLGPHRFLPLDWVGPRHLGLLGTDPPLGDVPVQDLRGELVWLSGEEAVAPAGPPMLAFVSLPPTSCVLQSPLVLQKPIPQHPPVLFSSPVPHGDLAVVHGSCWVEVRETH